VNRADTVRALVTLGLVADKVKRQLAELRSELETQARDEYASRGMAPTWNLPGVATVGLVVADTTVAVSDEKALTAWMVRNRPSEVETVTRLREAGVKALLAEVTVEGDAAALPDGDIVPGLTVIHGGHAKNLTVRPTTDAKALLGAEASAMVESLMAVLVEPVGTETPV
jgi:hypothetical protein